ncbi:hypothetical protein [Fibrella aquatilis]|uniref:Uncharacterized protein n=1 Tax=Fibrella aquatilis TaxID=2817059 RepID=A0A939JUI4_9BACT|nr:hypothetical protein [Fibrella aquatilis]MBO0929812.1 hypothetical protein [Fibrella aquatilis]
MDTIIILAIIGGVIYFLYTVSKKRKTVVVNENSFYQNGVKVDFTTGMITIGKHTYPVSKVTGIKSNTLVKTKASILANQGSVDIEVDDFVKPVHKINFNGYSVDKDTKEFAQRLSIALRKAGGPNFT